MLALATLVYSTAPVARRSPGGMPPASVAVTRHGDRGGVFVTSLMPAHRDELDEPFEGQVAAQELRLFAEHVWPGDLLNGYAAPANDRLDVCWHPFGHQTLIDACQRLLLALSAPDAYGVLPVGFKSPPSAVQAAVGTTRTQFKNAAACAAATNQPSFQ